MIGCELCEKLYNAFVFYEDEYEKFANDLLSGIFSDILMGIYHKFKQAFRIGKDGGAVEFC